MPTYVYPEDSENMLINDATFRQAAYTDMQDYASKIQEIISGNGVTMSQEELAGWVRINKEQLAEMSDDFKRDVVTHNVAFLETLVAYDVWTSEDMTAVNNAITDGNAY